MIESKTIKEAEDAAIRRCADVARAYADLKSGISKNNVAAIKAMAAREIASLIEQMPRKEGR